MYPNWVASALVKLHQFGAEGQCIHNLANVFIIFTKLDWSTWRIYIRPDEPCNFDEVKFSVKDLKQNMHLHFATHLAILGLSFGKENLFGHSGLPSASRDSVYATQKSV
jgi:hypothetical protein